MSKKFSNIIFIGALVILALLMGVNMVNNFKNIEIKNLYGDRSELGDVDFSVKKNLGAFFESQYKVGKDSINSKINFVGEGENKVIYKNRDVLRGAYVDGANFYDSKDYMAVINSEYGKKRVDLILKDKKSEEVKKTSIKLDEAPRILGVFGENNKIKFITEERENEFSNLIIIKEFNFETNTLKNVANVGSYSQKIEFNCREGEDYYISKITSDYDESKAVDEMKNLNIYKINLKDNTFKEYDIRKILEENNIDLKGKYFYSLDVSDGVAYIKISDSIDWSNIPEDEKIRMNHKYEMDNMPKVYSIATLNLKGGKVDFYKDCLNIKEVDKYIKNISQPMNLKILNGKLYFSVYVGESNRVSIGVVDLKSNKLIYLGEIKNVRMNGGFHNKE